MNDRDRNIESLDYLFRPRSVAVIGASRKKGSVGAEIFRNLLATGFTGAVYPVNPGASSVQAVKTWPRVQDIPDQVDLAIVVVPKEHVLAAVDDCGAAGVKGLIVISAGFAETGREGKELQDELVRRVRARGMRMVGPNCLGLLNTDPEIQVDATFAPTWPPVGNVSFSSQSGALGLAILDTARELGIGLRHFVSVGNKADVSGNDLLEYWENDPKTQVVLLYLESFGNPKRFMQIARRFTRKKPIVVVKSGRTEAGARAASSHTGSLAGMDVAVDALLGQAGVLRTDTIEGMFDLAMVLANQPVPSGNRVAILSNAGGPAIMASDACESHGLLVPPLSAESEAALRAFLPAEASVKNPVDMIASAPATSYDRALEIVLRDPGIDAVIVLFVPPVVTDATEVADAIRRAAAGADKPVLTCFMGTHGIPPALTSLREGRLPSYAFPEAAAIALSRAVRYGKCRSCPEGRIPELGRIDAPRARALIERAPAGAWLDPEQVREILTAYGIPGLGAELARSADDAVAAAGRVGLPVAVKLVSPTITHKSEVGGVVLGCEDEAAVREAFDSIRGRLVERARVHEMAGVIVQAMAPRGVETFVGVTQAPSFGPLLAFGIGGVHVELWKDVVFRVHPITDVDACEMLDQIRGKALLDGFRGEPPADRAALVDALLRVSRMVTDLPEIAELDLNPLVALRPGQGVVAVDARIRRRVG